MQRNLTLLETLCPSGLDLTGPRLPHYKVWFNQMSWILFPCAKKNPN